MESKDKRNPSLQQNYLLLIMLLQAFLMLLLLKLLQAFLMLLQASACSFFLKHLLPICKRSLERKTATSGRLRQRGGKVLLFSP